MELLTLNALGGGVRDATGAESLAHQDSIADNSGDC